MLKRRTVLVCLTVLSLTLAVSTRVYGQSTSGPEAWETIYNNAVAHATTTIPQSSLLGIITGLIDDLVTFLNVYNLLSGFWAG
jgi:ABC-type oligopeptide transport system substrate-binding subunit